MLPFGRRKPLHSLGLFGEVPFSGSQRTFLLSQLVSFRGIFAPKSDADPKNCVASAARLHQLGVPTLIIDRNPRVGDNWRNR